MGIVINKEGKRRVREIIAWLKSLAEKDKEKTCHNCAENRPQETHQCLSCKRLKPGTGDWWQPLTGAINGEYNTVDNCMICGQRKRNIKKEYRTCYECYIENS